MRSRFDEQLALLNRELIEMGALCEEVIALSAQALTEGNAELAARVAPLDQEIDRKEREIESLCLKLLLQQQPVAKDLRQISAALKMITDMERIGDQAEDIAEIITFLGGRGAENSQLLREMARSTIKMVTESVDAYVKHDTALADQVIAEDDTVDDYFARVKKDLIKRIVEVAAMPQFVGKILFLQNYDMELARRMVQGVDVWLNTPTRPLEASGTSGEKCVMNGVLQFSVLDGWWVEGYKEGAGWMLPMERTFADQGYQDELDAEMIYNTIEEQIVPKYYDRGSDGIPHQWVDSVKKCVADIASNFTTNRMLGDYEERFYNKLAARKREIVEGGYKLAREIAAWKRKVSAAWDKVRVIDVQRVRIDDEAIFVGEKYHFEVTVDIANLRPEDIGVEMVIAQQIVGGGKVNVTRTIGLKHTKTDGSRVTYALDYVPGEAGTFDVALRLYPYNPHLPHRMDFALVKWA